MGFVPALKLHQYKNVFFAESMPILELLEETFPQPSFLPEDPIVRQKVRQICEVINAGMQPANVFYQKPTNAQQRTGTMLEQDDFSAIQKRGLSALESLISNGPFCVGSTLTMADLYIVPQLRNLDQRFEV